MERRIDRRFKWRFILRTAVLFVPPLAAFVFVWREGGWPEWNALVATIFFAAWIVTWIVIDTVTFRSYRCPSCGQKIPRSSVSSTGGGDPIRYRCPACGVEWDTGLREASE